MNPPSDRPTSPASAGQLRPGTSVGGNRYVLKQLLGHGGMGIVWLANDKRLIEQVALKFLPSDIVHDPAALSDLRQETLRSRKLSHPNILRIYDLFEAPNELPFISMEFVDGPDLHYLRARRPAQVLSWPSLLPVLRQLCSALEYAHDERVIHRDLKPANLILDSKERLKLADFGLACVMHDSMHRLSGQGSTAGTINYMSPQQADGLKPTHLDDIYSLGATLYELLTSQTPFVSGDIAYQIRNNRPQSMAERLLELGLSNEIPSDVSALVMACLAKDPELRPQSVRAIMDWLELSDKKPVAVSHSPPSGVGIPKLAPPPPPPKKTPPPPPPTSAPIAPKVPVLPTLAPSPIAPPASEPGPFASLASPPIEDAEPATPLAAAFPGRRIAIIGLAALLLLGFGIWFSRFYLKKTQSASQARDFPAAGTSALAQASSPAPASSIMPTPRVTSVPPTGADGYEILFNGRDLSGWEGDPRFWSVNNSAILGRFNSIVGGAQVNTALFYRGAPLEDFELRFFFRGGAGSYDIIYRAREATNFQAFGYACTLWMGSQVFGGLHELFPGGTRGLTMHQYAASQAGAFLKTNDWNEMLITVRSNRIEHRLNGTPVCLASDNSPNFINSGALALALNTISSIGPNGIEFKDIRLKRLSATSAPAPVSNAPAAPPATFAAIFNGKDLSGWFGDPKLWSVRDGAIVGRIPRTAPTRRYFLFWGGEELGDFELRLSFRLGSGVGNRGGYTGNYGIYYWTRRPDLLFPGGLEYDLKKGLMGSLYYHLDNISYAELAKFNSAALYRSESWNQVRIIARGRLIVHNFNTAVSANKTITYSIFTPGGGLALEMNHNTGWESTIEFRDIALKRL